MRSTVSMDRAPASITRIRAWGESCCKKELMRGAFSVYISTLITRPS